MRCMSESLPPGTEIDEPGAARRKDSKPRMTIARIVIYQNYRQDACIVNRRASFRNLEQEHPVPIAVMVLAGRGELMRSAVSNRPPRDLLISSIGWIEPPGFGPPAKLRPVNCDRSRCRDIHNDR